MDYIPIVVCKNLKLDVPRMLYKMFNIHRFISKSDPGFFPCCLETLLKFFRVLCHTHSLSATTECCLDNNRITDFFCDLCPFLHIINCLFTPRNDRDSCFYHGIPCLRFISEPADHVRWWSDIDNITLLAQTGCSLKGIQIPDGLHPHRIPASH